MFAHKNMNPPPCGKATRPVGVAYFETRLGNAFVRTDPAGNLKIDKEKSTEKVDGAVALVMALDRAMKNQNEGSVYDDRGFLIL